MSFPMADGSVSRQAAVQVSVADRQFLLLHFMPYGSARQVESPALDLDVDSPAIDSRIFVSACTFFSS